MHLFGPPGTGKSHLAIALGVEAVRAGKSVYMASLAEIVDSMRRAEREGKLGERVRYLSRYSLLIVDEIGYLPGPGPPASCVGTTTTIGTAASLRQPGSAPRR